MRKISILGYNENNYVTETMLDRLIQWPARAGILFMVFLLLTETANSQECALKLQEAQAQFDRGRVELVPDLLTPCLNSGGFTKEDGLMAYKLLIQSLLLDDKNADADAVMLRFLSRNPEYEVTAADYSGFVYLRTKYKVLPRLYLSAQTGLNYTYLTGHSEKSLSSLPPGISYSREPFNVYAGVEGAIPVTGKMALAAGISYSASSFRYTENMMNFGTVLYRESQSRLEIPVSVVYKFAGFRDVDLYVRGGAGYVFNLTANAEASFTTSDINNGFNRTGENLDRRDSRIKSDIFIHAGLGGRVKIPRGYITAELRTLSGLRNQVAGLSDPGNLEYYYFYTDDNFRINIAGLTVGYTFIFYKPTKTQGQ